MSKDSAPTGLFSKVVKFVRHPATSWADLDTVAEQQDPNYSKQALKEMIERKRRNDFVRKREFDMLRKLRSKTDVSNTVMRGRPSFFQSSYSSRPDDRAGTLKKIDEIEAQMSMQWWKTKQRPDDPNTDMIDSERAYQTTAEAKQTTVAAGKDKSGKAARVEEGSTLPMTQVLADGAATARTTATPPPMDDGIQPSAGQVRQVPAQQRPHRMDTDLSYPMGGDDGHEASTFSASKFYALDVNELAMDPEIEEAAIRFASGDDVATEQGLLDVLTRKGAGGTPDEWMALLDLYRATGQVEAFDVRAIDFASRFSKSAPQWISLPDEVAKRVAKSVSAPVSQPNRAAWVCEADLDAHAVTLLSKVLERVAPPWRLDWSALQSIQPMAVTRLFKLMSSWAQSDVELHFTGTKRLLNTVQAMTVSGDRGVDKVCWDLHLALLRVMNLPDDFELTALDFCVTYEISPPGWEQPRCSFRDVDAGKLGMAGLSEIQPLLDRGSDGQPGKRMGLRAQEQADLEATSSFSFLALQGELIGELQGDPSEQLARLDELLLDSTQRSISCRLLVRVDFAAAGAILNWVSAHHAEGRRIRFVEVHRLISAFFHVIGITEHADVDTRPD